MPITYSYSKKKDKKHWSGGKNKLKTNVDPLHYGFV